MACGRAPVSANPVRFGSWQIMGTPDAVFLNEYLSRRRVVGLSWGCCLCPELSI
jgi:hypothetical protein